LRDGGNRPRKGGKPRRPFAEWLIFKRSSHQREETPRPCKSLLALLLVGAGVVFLTRSASANPFPPQPPVCRPVFPPAPVSPGELPGLEPEPNRHTLTIYNGAHVEQRNFVEKNGSWRSCGEFQNYDVFFRDGPRSPWRFYGTYYSARSAEEAACSLRDNGNLVSVRQHCA
jgi:hypothetical protein